MLVGPVALGLGVELDRVVLLGLAEGTFPARRREDPLLPDRERRSVGADLAPRSERVGADHRALLAVLAGAAEAIMTFPRGDLRRGADRAPSRWLLDAVEQRDGIRPATETLTTASGDWFDEVPSFVAGLRRCEFPGHQQEYDMLALLTAREAGLDLTAHPVLDARPEIRLGVSLLTARGSRSFTRFDGNLATDGDLRGARLPSPTDPDAVASATRLEAWAACPHAYFVHHVLGVAPVEAPDREHRMSPLVRGELVHRALDRWLGEAIENDAVPAPEQPWPPDRRRRLIEIGQQECDRVQARGLAGRGLYWERDRRRILADLEQTLAFDDAQRRAGGVRPIATELRFGLPGTDRGPVAVVLPDGRRVWLRGSIDRVDAGDSGQLVVIDYKTGRSEAYKDLSADDPTPGGGHLQLVLYAAAARAALGRESVPVRGAYWFVSTAGRFAERGYQITPPVEHDVLSIVAAVSDGIASGLYPLHPAEPRWRARVPCWFCEPDGLGTRDQWRDWERKRDDPAMRPYLDVAEPDLLNHVGSGGG